MVWALFPVHPLSGEDKYYIFRKGVYKVGRRGCDVILDKGKGVSRIHAEIIIDEMTLLSPLESESGFNFRVRIRDCSKYGTFVNKNLGSVEKIHELPNKETVLKGGDIVSFGTGNSTYRFSVIPLIFFAYCSESFQVNDPLEDKVSSIGARITNRFSNVCTHVLVEQFMPVKEDLLDAIVAEKHIVLRSWVELVAEKSVGSELPSWSSLSIISDPGYSGHVPTLTVDGISVKVADSRTRANCLKGYTCILGSINKYMFRNRMQSLLEAGGAKVTSIEEFCPNSQELGSGVKSCMMCVIPRGSAEDVKDFSKLSSFPQVNEMDLLCAVLSGRLDSSLLIYPSVVVSSSCSDDETVVADSDVEEEVHATADLCSKEAPKGPKHLSITETTMVQPPIRSEAIHVVNFVDGNDYLAAKRKRDESESGNPDIIYSQDLIVRELNSPAAISSERDTGVLNFKCFRKKNTQSGNSFKNLIPFSKYPFKDSSYGNQEMQESAREEKKRKQMEAIAEDLFNNERGRRRGFTGSLSGLLSSG